MNVTDPNGYNGTIDHTTPDGRFTIILWDDGTYSSHLTTTVESW